MGRFTHWLFELSLFPRLVMLVLLFGLLGGGLFFSLRESPTSEINSIEEKTCNPAVASVDPSRACTDPKTYHDFRYICASGAQGYLGLEEPHCLSLDQAQEKIAEYCRDACLSQ